jgi:3-isopropylmalate dehydrogenase
MATILSAALLLRYSLGLEQEAQAVEAAVYATLDAGIVTGDIAAPGAQTYSTREVGQAVIDRMFA